MLPLISRYLVASNWAYFTLLFGWLVLSALTGDRLAPVALANLLAVYLFFPLPLALFGAWRTRRVELWIGSLAALFAFLWLWGGLFVPAPSASGASEPTLRVLTFNALGYAANPKPQVDMISSQDTEVVFLQELNPALAALLASELAEQYPYQALDPQPGVHGMGVLSKYPLLPAGEALSLDWVGEPQVLEMAWQGQRVTLVNFHMIPSTLGTLPILGDQSLYRQAEAQAIVELARRRGPLIAAGDANTTPTSQAYRILAGTLQDTWAEAGFGFGHTFPGSDGPGSSRPSLAGIAVPMWLARIDYIFASPQWRVVNTNLAPFDGVSDHRGVVADIVLR
jgi:endonuclease/exonuclease/phosphatase (EEP) superfamily protein YafD